MQKVQQDSATGAELVLMRFLLVMKKMMFKLDADGA
jgi:hypothetical protein